jgi:hypothetical protein
MALGSHSERKTPTQKMFGKAAFPIVSSFAALCFLLFTELNQLEQSVISLARVLSW